MAHSAAFETTTPESERETAAGSVTKQVTLIVNPVSCPNGVQARLEEIVPILERLGWRVQAFETTEPEGALPEAKRAVESGTDMVIVVGGDGTVMEAMNALIGTQIPIAILPSGTGNLLALNLGIPWDLPHSLDIAATGKPVPIDLVKVNGGEKYFAIMGGVGYDARIMEETDRKAKQKFGRLAYVQTALKHLYGERFPVDLSVDGQPVRYMAKSVLVANMGEILKGVKVFPEASPRDGIVEVGVLKASSLLDFVRLLFHTILGQPSRDPAFDSYQARRVTVSARRAQPLELDGDVVARTSKIEMEVVPGAVHVMLPPPAEPGTAASVGADEAGKD